MPFWNTRLLYLRLVRFEMPPRTRRLSVSCQSAAKSNKVTAGTFAGMKFALADVPTGRFESWKYWLLVLVPVMLALKVASLRKVMPYLAVTFGAKAGRLPA